jgi:hypothetical protein
MKDEAAMRLRISVKTVQFGPLNGKDFGGVDKAHHHEALRLAVSAVGM